MEQPTFTPPYQPIALNGTEEGAESRRSLRKAVTMRAHLRDRGQTRFEKIGRAHV